MLEPVRCECYGCATTRSLVRQRREIEMITAYIGQLRAAAVPNRLAGVKVNDEGDAV